MLKAIHAQEDRQTALEKAEAVIEKLKGMNLVTAAKTVEEGIRETLAYTSFPRSTGGSSGRILRWSASCGRYDEGLESSATSRMVTRPLCWSPHDSDISRAGNGA